jgi:hypothetical protein
MRWYGTGVTTVISRGRLRQVDSEFDIPQYDVSGLIRAISANGGRLPANKRDRYGYLPEEVVLRIEAIVREAFHLASDSQK